MEKLNIEEIVVLEDDSEYTCFANFIVQGKDIVFLINNLKPSEIKFAEQILENGELQLRIIDDTKEKDYLLSVYKNKYNQNL